MTTLGEAVAQFGNNPRGGAKTVAEALRVPKAVVEEAMIAPKGPFASMDVSDLQVSPMNAGGMDPNVVAYVDQKARQWQGAMEVTLSQHIAALSRGLHEKTDALDDRITDLERDLSAARLRNARLHDETDALKMALGGAQTLISAAEPKPVAALTEDQVWSLATALLAEKCNWSFEETKPLIGHARDLGSSSGGVWFRMAQRAIDHIEYLRRQTETKPAA